MEASHRMPKWNIGRGEAQMIEGRRCGIPPVM